MRNPSRLLILVAILVLALLPASAQDGPVATWQVRVNQARLDEGLAPYGFSSLLTAAAQRHADDLAVNQIWSHTGSDGSTASQRIAAAGYAAWTWNSGELVVGENFWTGYGTIDDAMTFFLDDPPHRDNLLSAAYREIGIGVATDTEGRNYYVLDFGVRPNVLPIFINDGASSTDDPQVAIRLTNEDARPGGEGATFMGQAIEIRIGNEPQFDDLPWQPWEPLVPWDLPSASGEHAVYVQFRDAAGRTAASADMIILGEGAAAAPPAVLPSPTPIPPSPIPEPTAMPVPTAAPTPEPAPIVEPSPTLPQPTVQLPSSTSLPPATPGPSVATPFPTWTPLPTVVPRETGETKAPITLLVTLQGVVIILGVYLALRRGQE
ncbi:MAG: hypothetical protein KKC18_04185 [Chloroflexi bacterium]|nr:hypothetical protein [Chloroflexota bacterium]